MWKSSLPQVWFRSDMASIHSWETPNQAPVRSAHSWEDRRPAPRPYDGDDDSDPDTDDETLLNAEGEEAGDNLANMLLSSLWAQKQSAKLVCTVAWWAVQAGAQSKILQKIAFRPNAPTGHFHSAPQERRESNHDADSSQPNP